MIFYKIIMCLIATRVSCSDWVSEWVDPIQDQFREERKGFIQRNISPLFDGDADTTIRLKNGLPEELELLRIAGDHNNEFTTESLKLKLEETLQNAKLLAESLKVQINKLISRERLLKEVIANGRLGVSTLTVSTMTQVPRSYIIRDGHWTLCNGMIQFPVSSQGTEINIFNELFKEPRCIGREVPTIPDRCVFNSIIKYEVVPNRRAFEYTEDDYLCLKTTFNKTLERYMSVTKQLLNDTCKEGIITTIDDNIIECGIRVLSEYSFYPYRSTAIASLPLEYCAEKDGSCKLIMAWHISNATVENFEFLKNEHDFKKYFIKNGAPKHVI